MSEIRSIYSSSPFSSLFDTVPTLCPKTMELILGERTCSPLVTVTTSAYSQKLILCVDVPQEEFYLLPWFYVRSGDKCYSLLQSCPDFMASIKLQRMRFMFDNKYARRRPPIKQKEVDTVRKVGVYRESGETLFFSVDVPGISVVGATQKYEAVLLSERPDACPIDVPSNDAQAILSHFQIPEWTDLRPTELSVYTEGYNDVEETHIGYMKVIISLLPKDYHVIAPGDGTGLAMRVCLASGRSCTSGDIVRRKKTHSRVLLEDASQTLERGKKESNGRPICCVLSYVSVFLTEAPDVPSIWIDTPQIMNRFSVFPISKNVYISGNWPFFPVIPAVKADIFRRAYKYTRPPYYLNLMELSHVSFEKITPTLSFLLKAHSVKVQSNCELVRQYVLRFGRTVTDVPGLLVVDTLGDLQRDRPFYFVPIGRVVHPWDFQKWDGVSKVNVRTIYEISKDVVLPAGMFEEFWLDCRYCYIPDMFTQKLYRRAQKFGSVFGDVHVSNKRVVDYRKDHQKYMFDNFEPLEEEKNYLQLNENYVEYSIDWDNFCGD